MSDILKKYLSIPYTKVIDTKDTKWKFESPFHFVSFIEDIEDKGINESNKYSSKKEDYDFSGSYSLEEAFKIFRETKKPELENKKSSVLINKIRLRNNFQEEGDEISVQEYISKSPHWLKYGNDKTRVNSHMFKFPLFIFSSYNCCVSQEKIYKAAKTIVNYFYENKIRFPKIICCFSSKNCFCREEALTFVDINYTDFNSLYRMIHPSTFRRIIFRLEEINKDLSEGYGKSTHISGSLKEGLVLSEYEHLTEDEIKDRLQKLVKESL